jgi:hypothetical protein
MRIPKYEEEHKSDKDTNYSILLKATETLTK